MGFWYYQKSRRTKMPFDIAAPRNHNDAKRAALEAAKAASAASTGKKDAIIRYILPADCPDRIRIVFDDSGSMSGQITNAKLGVVEFLRNCIPNQTSVAVHPMCTTTWSTALRSDLPQLGRDVEECNFHLGGTPFFNTLKKALEATPTLTRLVAFTDGSPSDELEASEDEEAGVVGYHSRSIDPLKSSGNIIIKIANNTGAGIPIDTVFFGVANEWTKRERELLKYLSDSTGGFFMVFDPAKVNFRTAFKYLAPVNRLQLTSGSFRAAIERGEKK
jgi:hypothetical protein